MDEIDDLLLDIFSSEKKCEKCDTPLEMQKKEKGIVIATCQKCGTPYTNVQPCVENGKLTFKATTELREFKKLPIF